MGRREKKREQEKEQPRPKFHIGYVVQFGERLCEVIGFKKLPLVPLTHSDMWAVVFKSLNDQKENLITPCYLLENA